MCVKLWVDVLSLPYISFFLHSQFQTSFGFLFITQFCDIVTNVFCPLKFINIFAIALWFIFQSYSCQSHNVLFYPRACHPISRISPPIFSLHASCKPCQAPYHLPIPTAPCITYLPSRGYVWPDHIPRPNLRIHTFGISSIQKASVLHSFIAAIATRISRKGFFLPEACGKKLKTVVNPWIRSDWLENTRLTSTAALLVCTNWTAGEL